VYGVKKLISYFPSKPWILSGFKKRLFNTEHFTFWVDLTKVTVTIVCDKKHQFMQLLTATFRDMHIENSKNYKR